MQSSFASLNWVGWVELQPHCSWDYILMFMFMSMRLFFIIAFCNFRRQRFIFFFLLTYLQIQLKLLDVDSNRPYHHSISRSRERIEGKENEIEIESEVLSAFKNDCIKSFLLTLHEQIKNYFHPWCNSLLRNHFIFDFSFQTTL